MAIRQVCCNSYSKNSKTISFKIVSKVKYWNLQLCHFLSYKHWVFHQWLYSKFCHWRLDWVIRLHTSCFHLLQLHYMSGLKLKIKNEKSFLSFYLPSAAQTPFTQISPAVELQVPVFWNLWFKYFFDSWINKWIWC